MKTLVEADCIVTPDGKILESGAVVIKGNRVDGYFKRPPEGKFERRVRIKGYLYPPFVNAHTHLELSNLNFNPDDFSSFFDWLLWIIGKRPLLSKGEIERGLGRAEEEISSGGTFYVGDISSFGISKGYRFKSIRAEVFSEFIGKDFHPEDFSFPVSAHSVYSVSFGALRKISEESSKRGLKFQLHLGETLEEEKFVRCKRNLFEEKIYPFLRRKRYERVCAENLVDYIERAGALNENLIAVHCTNLSEKEIERLAERGASIVLCPRSNLHLKVGFPKVKNILGYEKLGLGTDGLSSNVDLSVVEELRVLYYQLKGEVRLRELFPLITSSGAKALGIEDYGKEPVFTVALPRKGRPDPFFLLLDTEVQFKVLKLEEIVDKRSP